MLNDSVNHLRDGRGEVSIRKLGVEKNLWAKESLVAYVHFEALCVCVCVHVKLVPTGMYVCTVPVC